MQEKQFNPYSVPEVTDSASDSWSAYWSQGSAEAACLPGAPAALGNLLDGIWGEFGTSLDGAASVVDLACGSGIVGTSMLAANAKLDLTGIDYAQLPDESLPPFPILREPISQTSCKDDNFDAAVSQFGIEYADPAEVGKELARILKAGAKLQFIVHYAGSAITKANEARANLLADANHQDVWQFANGRNLAGLQSTFDAICKKHGETPLFLELASAVRAALGNEGSVRTQVLKDLQASMEHEMEIIASLMDAAIAPDQMELWMKQLGKKFSFDGPNIIRIGDDIICWHIAGEYKP